MFISCDVYDLNNTIQLQWKTRIYDYIASKTHNIHLNQNCYIMLIINYKFIRLSAII